MTKTRISKILAKDTLSGKSKHIKDGVLTFDRITISQHSPEPAEIGFYFKDNFLISIKADGNLSLYSTFTFHLADDKMKMYYEDEDICEEPEQSLQSQINEI